MARLISFRPLLAPVSALVLLTACSKDDHEQPAPAPAELKGDWTRTKSYYKYTDAQGNTTNSGGGIESAPATVLTISDATFAFKWPGNLHEYFYKRTSDSTAYTYYIYQNRPIEEKNYSIVELREHSLVIRYAWKLSAGGYFMEKEFYTR